MIKKPADNVIREQIKHLTGDDFQEFCNSLLLALHGPSDFVILRRKSDQGADGIVKPKNQVIACFGPENPGPYSKFRKSFEKKAASDFQSYQDNWEQIYPGWAMYVNHEIAPEELKFIQGLRSANEIHGLSGLMEVLNGSISSSRRRSLLALLNVPPEFISMDFVSGFLEDVLNASPQYHKIKYSQAAYVPDKIAINYSELEADSIRNEFDLLWEQYASYIHGSFMDFDESEKSRIKAALVSDFNTTYGSTFREKFDQITGKYTVKYGDDEDSEMKMLIRAVMFWVFSQCLIGKKVPDEMVGQ